MFKKYLCTFIFLSATIVLSGCSLFDKKAEKEAPAPVAEKVNAPTYIVTVKPPTSAKAGVKDPTEGYIKINPTFDPMKLPPKAEKIKWLTKGFGASVPAFPQGNLLEVINTENQFLAYIANVDENTFKSYITILEKAGYNTKTNTTWESFKAVGKDCEINLRFGQDGFKVTTLRAKSTAPAAKTAESKPAVNN